MYFGSQKTSLRRRVANYLDTTNLGIYLELLQAILSLCSCALYVGESYYQSDEVPQWMDVVDLILVIIFACDFALHLFIAEKKLTYVFSRDGMIDILTVVPVLAGMIATDYIAYRHVFFFLRPARVLRAIRILRFLPAATKSTAARRQLILLIFSAVCLIFIFAGLFQYVENSSILGDTIQRGDGRPYPFLPFHEAVYFIVILAYTVSFGDPIPTNWLGKLVAMLYMTVTALVIPLQIRKLIKILAMQKDGGWVVKSRKNLHYIATGSINPTNIASFLNDFFDERNKHDKTKVVVLSGNFHSDEIDVIHLPLIENKVSWLFGSVLVPVDLLRSQVRTAKGAFIFADHVTSEPDKEDKMNIMRALALRKHNPNMTVSLQLIDSSWKVHVNDDSIYAFALDEIKMSMMAWSTLYPGYSTLLSNMLMWRLQIARPVNPPAWLSEYASGLNQTMFEAEVPHRYVNDTFSSVIMDIYNQYGITVVGLRKGTTKKISIAPLNVSMDDRLVAGDSFLLLSDVAQLTEFCGTNSQYVKDLYFYDDRNKKPFYQRIPLVSKIVRRRDDIFDSFALDVQSDHRELQDEAIVTGENTGVFFHESYEDSLVGRKGPRKRRAVRELVHQDILSPRSLRMTTQPKEHFRASPTSFLVDLDNDPNRTRGRSIESCTVSRLEPHVKNHIVLCGCPRSRLGLYHFMQPYLNPARHPGDSNVPIVVVVLSPEPPTPEVWAEVNEMNNILYMRGSALNSEDLRNAGIDRAMAVVVLSTGSSGVNHHHKARSYAQIAEALYLQDADVILSTRAIQANLQNNNAKVFVISETAHTKTFNLLAYNDTDNSDFFLAPEFASGYFYDSGMTQRLIYQCHDKPFIRDMLNKLFSTKRKKRSTFISQIPVPDLEKMTYGTLFSYAVPRSMIPIGLYRPMLDEEAMANNNNELQHFVILNPPSNTIITSQDRVFVWCSFVR